MLNLQVDNWHYLHGSPITKGLIKEQLSDFKVHENLSFTPSGAGEHTFIQLEKTGLNTAYIAEQLAKYANLPLRNVTYAGRKDKYATTTQWFGIYHANKAKADWTKFSHDGVIIKTITQNDRKLRTGAIQSNRFDILVRQTGSYDQQALIDRIEQIKHLGVPNYFGNQRFGEIYKADGTKQLGGNLQLAAKLLGGEDIRNRNKRSMAISALRSWLFNHFVSQRISSGKANTLVDGDAILLAGSNSFFVYSKDDVGEAEKINKRLAKRDVYLSAPLWGKGQLQSRSQAWQMETRTAENYHNVCESLATLGMEQQRRAVLIFPEDFELEISDNSLRFAFSLPAGCFATSVLREIIDC